MKTREATLLHTWFSKAVRDPAAAGNGKAPVWYHKHWRQVNDTSYPIQVYESAQLCSRLNTMRRDMMYAVRLHLMMHVYRCLSTADQRASLCGPTI
jgi:hypothetical protein